MSLQAKNCVQNEPDDKTLIQFHNQKYNEIYLLSLLLWKQSCKFMKMYHS